MKFSYNEFMIAWIVSFFDRLFAFIGALLFSQIPSFMQQYQQHLSGHISELNLQISLLRQIAEKSNKSLDEYIKKFLDSDDLDFSRQGEYLQNMVTRYVDMSSSYVQLKDADVWHRPLIFLRNLYSDIGWKTYENYEFAIIFSLEGLVYALLGFLFGFCVFFLIKSLFRSLIPHREKSAREVK